MNLYNVIKAGKGYYATERAQFIDHHANHIEEGFTKRFLVFINNYEFHCTGWKNKESLKKSDIKDIQRGGKYKIEDDKIKLIYEPGGWKEECTIVDENTLLHHFSEPAKKMTYKEWKD